MKNPIRTKSKTKPGGNGNKNIRRRRSRWLRFFQNALIAVFLVLLIFCLFHLSRVFSVYEKGAKEYRQLVEESGEVKGNEGEELTKADLDGLRRQNPETAAWIEVPGTRISYPVMHTENNVYYLNHTFSGEENIAGSIFMEALNAEDFTDIHTVVYGHNMRNGTMFAGLKKWREESYFEEHPYIYLTLDGGIYRYDIFSCYTTREDSAAYTLAFGSEEERENFLRELKENRLYDTGVEVDTEDRILTLSTCTANGEKRFVVHAKYAGLENGSRNKAPE